MNNWIRVTLAVALLTVATAGWAQEWSALSDSQREHFNGGHDLDFSYVGEEGGRFRVNLFRKASGVGAVFRHIPNEVPTLEQLALRLAGD